MRALLGFTSFTPTYDGVGIALRGGAEWGRTLQ
jgi:hypothetical protein